MTNITIKSYIIGIIVALAFILLLLLDSWLTCDIPSQGMRLFIDALFLFLITMIFSHILFVQQDDE